MNGSYTERLAKYIIIAAGIFIAYVLCATFSKVLTYILGAAVVALVGRPLTGVLERIRISGRSLPSWLCAVLTIVIVTGTVLGILLLVAPVFTGIASDVSQANLSEGAAFLAQPLDNLNSYLRSSFSSLGADFRIENVILKRISSLFNISMFSSLISGVASFLASFGVALFSIIFISFFFVKNASLLPDVVAAFVPEQYEVKARESMSEIGGLVSRYFSGLALEVFGVTVLNFLGLMFIARMGLRYSLGIAFMTGVLNVIPYVGPLIGEVMGTVLAVIIKYACSGGFGLDVSAAAFILIVLAILLGTQLIDNFVYQPLIYSNSIKAHPLEVFIVLLLAGTLRGVVGILVAVPVYTVLRVVAIKFFGENKAVRRLLIRE